LEHLHELDVAMATIGRVVKPGGRAFVGVPIFPPPLHLARRYLVPTIDAITRHRGNRTHVQAFSLASFKAKMLAHSGLRVLETRGFRIISGGILRPLENHRWWWAFNRRLGAIVPAACIEVQAVLEKPVT
jgi:SAM-dependent methyltransferase